MAEDTEAGSTTLKVRFRRVIQVRQYHSEEAEVLVEETYPGALTPEDIIAQADSLFALAKSEVYKQVGLQFEMDGEGVIKAIEAAFPGAQTIESKALTTEPIETPKAAPVRPPRALRAAPPEPEEEPQEPRRAAPRAQAPKARPAARRPAQARSGGSQRRATPEGESINGTSIPGWQMDLWNELMDDPSQWWDNREGKRNPAAPDYKHKTKEGQRGPLALWLTAAPLEVFEALSIDPGPYYTEDEEY